MASESKSEQRWGPSEWFGMDVSSMSDATRLSTAKDALLPNKDVQRLCPYMGDVIDGFRCNKKGGICSIQKYVERDGRVQLEGTRVAICPSRLVTKAALRHIAKTVLGTEDAFLVKEVPYSLSLVRNRSNGKPTYAGRIDWLLVSKTNHEQLCAVETQAVYMSGKSQNNDFEGVVKANGKLVLPPNSRRPDYKSSVPKRLAPQLESKARHLTRTGKKTVVLVDDFVEQNMYALQEIKVPSHLESNPAAKKQHMLETCEIVFAVVSLEQAGTLSNPTYKFSSITDTRDALDAVSAMLPTEFFKTVKDIVAPKLSSKLAASKKPPAIKKNNKVFSLAPKAPEVILLSTASSDSSKIDSAS